MIGSVRAAGGGGGGAARASGGGGGDDAAHAAGGGGAEAALPQQQPYAWADGEAQLPPITIPAALLKKYGRSLQQHRLAVVFATATGPWALSRRWHALPEGERAAWRLRAAAAFALLGAEFEGMPALLDAAAGKAGEQQQQQQQQQRAQAVPPAWFGQARIYRPMPAPFFNAARASILAVHPEYSGGRVRRRAERRWAALADCAKLEWEVIVGRAIK
jgi:hypothetical protein